MYFNYYLPFTFFFLGGDISSSPQGLLLKVLQDHRKCLGLNQHYNTQGKHLNPCTISLKPNTCSYVSIHITQVKKNIQFMKIQKNSNFSPRVYVIKHFSFKETHLEFRDF